MRSVFSDFHEKALLSSDRSLLSDVQLCPPWGSAPSPRCEGCHERLLVEAPEHHDVVLRVVSRWYSNSENTSSSLLISSEIMLDTCG
jgi:hypothetical protein